MTQVLTHDFTQDSTADPDALPACLPEPPVWERIGADLTRARTGPDALRAAGLDWAVEQWPVQATDPVSWRTVPAAGHLANVRADTRQLLGVVGKGYRVFQNAQLFEFLGALVADRLVSFAAAGCLRGGRRVWALLRLPRACEAAPGDPVRPHLLVVNGHAGDDGPLRMLPCTVRDACGNAFVLPPDDGTGPGDGGRGLAVRHLGDLDRGLAEARRNLGRIAARFEQFAAEARALAATPLASGQVDDYFDALVADADGGSGGRDRVLARLRGTFGGPSNARPGVAGTAWAAFNAVGEWADGRAGRGRDGRARDEARLDAVWFGSAHRVKRAAYRAALGLAGLN